jgi:hypothetical protein
MSGALDGISFELKLFNKLKDTGIEIYFDRNVVNKYGIPCWGVDIVCIKDNKIIITQCKRSKNASDLRDVNHFIRGALIIKQKENKECKLFWCCKKIPTADGIESLKCDNVCIIEESDQNTCICKSFNEICSFLELSINDNTIVLNSEIDNNSSEKKPTKKLKISEEDNNKILNKQTEITQLKNNIISQLNNFNFFDMSDKSNLIIFIESDKYKEFKLYFEKNIMKKYRQYNYSHNYVNVNIINDINIIIKKLNELNKITGKKSILELPQFDRIMIHKYENMYRFKSEEEFNKNKTPEQINKIIYNLR